MVFICRQNTDEPQLQKFSFSCYLQELVTKTFLCCPLHPPPPREQLTCFWSFLYSSTLTLYPGLRQFRTLSFTKIWHSCYRSYGYYWIHIKILQLGCLLFMPRLISSSGPTMADSPQQPISRQTPDSPKNKVHRCENFSVKF